jgi:hypothetical protein
VRRPTPALSSDPIDFLAVADVAGRQRIYRLIEFRDLGYARRHGQSAGEKGTDLRGTIWRVNQGCQAGQLIRRPRSLLPPPVQQQINHWQ